MKMRQFIYSDYFRNIIETFTVFGNIQSIMMLREWMQTAVKILIMSHERKGEIEQNFDNYSIQYILFFWYVNIAVQVCYIALKSTALLFTNMSFVTSDITTISFRLIFPFTWHN